MFAGAGAPFELFKPGTTLPQRRVIDVPGVTDDIQVNLVEAANGKGGGDKGDKSPALAGGGSRLPSSIGATRSGADPAPFAGYKITGVKAALKTFVKAEEAARPGTYCSSLHRIPCSSRHEDSKVVSKWRAIHVIRFYVTQVTRVRSAWDDMASSRFKALGRGAGQAGIQTREG